MFGKVFESLSLTDIQALVDEGIPEGRQLEYKRDHYGRDDKNKREFAADVSAMANAFGGYLVVGIDERNGIASDVRGVKASNPDQLVLSVSESIRQSCEPPLLEFQVKWISIQGELGILLIKIERSWNAPHRVTIAKSQSFFMRDENGKHPMSVAELRRAFVFASEVDERIRNFRIQRLEILNKNEGPLAVGKEDDARLVIQVVPRVSFTDGIQLSFNEPRGGAMWPWPLNASGANNMYSLDGLVSYSGPEGQIDTVRAFSTLFRNGVAEAVAKVYVDIEGSRRTISLDGIENSCISAIQQILGEYEKRKIPAPYILMISLLGMRGVEAPMNGARGGISYPHRSERILLPELSIDAVKATGAPEEILKPLFDLMWNAFGQYGSPNNDHRGNYVRR